MVLLDMESELELPWVAGSGSNSYTLGLVGAEDAELYNLS